MDFNSYLNFPTLIVLIEKMSPLRMLITSKIFFLVFLSLFCGGDHFFIHLQPTQNSFPVLHIQNAYQNKIMRQHLILKITKIHSRFPHIGNWLMSTQKYLATGCPKKTTFSTTISGTKGFFLQSVASGQLPFPKFSYLIQTKF